MNFTLFVMRFIIKLKPIIKFRKFEKNFTTIVPQIFKRNERIVYTESEVTSRNLRSLYDRHVVGLTWHYVCS